MDTQCYYEYTCIILTLLGNRSRRSKTRYGTVYKR